MADLKISALPASTTPLAGTEIVPLVQSSTTKNVSVSNLTAGRAVSVGSLTATTGTVNVTYAAPEVTLTPTSAGRESDIKFVQSYGTYYFGIERSGGGSFGATSEAMMSYAPSGKVIQTLIGGTGIITTVDPNGLKLNAGNLIQGTAATGINFTANTPAAGKTSQLLNWYEEGNWTPTVTADSGTITTYTASGSYTRVGNVVELRFAVNVSNVGSAAGALKIAGLPFTSVAYADTYPAGTFLVRETGLTGQVYQGFVNANSTQAFVAALSGATVNWTNGVVYVFSGTYRCA